MNPMAYKLLIYCCAVTAVILSACAASPHRDAQSVGFLFQSEQWRGDLKNPSMPVATIKLVDKQLEVWASLEFQANARVQAAQSGLDALLRSELSKFMRVHVLDVMEDRSDIEEQRVDRITQEITTAQLRGVSMIERAWTIRTGEKNPVLYMLGRLRVPQDAIRKVIAAEPFFESSRTVILERMFPEVK